jgi:hypothetical protein
MNDELEGPVPPTGSGKKIALILAIVGGVGLICLLACGGCGYWMFKAFTTDLPAAQASANAFLDDLQSSRIESAYGQTTQGFQASMTLQQFRDFLKQYSTFTSQTSRTQNGFRVYSGTGGKQATVQMTLRTSNNAMTCTLILMQEGEQWKVHHLSVP